MRFPRLVGAVGALVVGASVVAGCGGAGTNPDLITVNGAEPEVGLITTDTSENQGGRIVDRLFTGLYYYDADGNPRPGMVDKLETTDNKNYTISIKRGWTFTDGTEVKAHNFVDAWNFGAYTPNAQKQQSFFAPIRGYDEVAAEKPTVRTMSGLKVVDDYTFTVALKNPAIDFKLGLGFTPFKPLPDVAFKDITAFGEHPVGNGPYKLQEWAHNLQATLVPNLTYPGENKARNKGLIFSFYTSFEAAYSDLLSGNLDFLDTIPVSALRTYKEDLGDRAITKPTAQNQVVAIPYRLPHFSGPEGVLRRQAISMAIDRKQITDTIFVGSRTPARDFTAHTLPGFNSNLPNASNLDYNPAKAVQLWNQANAISPWSGKFVLASNYDGGHKEWIEAAANSVKNVLKINAVPEAVPTFAQLRQQVNARTIDTAFRAGWQGDYPSMLEFLEPIYVTGAGSNDVSYSSPAFDAKIRESEAQRTDQDSYRVTGQAQSILLNDLPQIPMWDYVANGGEGENVNAPMTWSGLGDFENMTKRLGA